MNPFRRQFQLLINLTCLADFDLFRLYFAR